MAFDSNHALVSTAQMNSNSTLSPGMGPQQGTSILSPGAYDPRDYIEVSAPDQIFLSQWSCVPIRCTLAEDDRKPTERPNSPMRNSGRSQAYLDGGSPSREDRYGPYCCEFIIPRQSFFFVHCDTMLDSFKNVVAKEGFPWLSYRLDENTRIPLPWQYPVAVVIDMIRMRRRHHPQLSCEEKVYPFEITLHLSEPKVTSASDPAYIAYLKTLRIKDLKGGLLFLRQLIKRSTCYAFGSLIPLLELEALNPDYFTELFEGIQENDPNKYWRGKCGLRYYGEVEREEDGEGIIANSLHLSTTTPSPSTTISGGAKSDGVFPGVLPPENSPSLVPTTPSKNNYSEGSVRQASAYPILLHCEGTSKLIRWKQNGQKLGQFLKEHVPWLEFLSREDIFHRHEPANFVLVQGISPFLSSPLEDLYELLASTDLFLHIVVRPMYV